MLQIVPRNLKISAEPSVIAGALGSSLDFVQETLWAGLFMILQAITAQLKRQVANCMIYLITKTAWFGKIRSDESCTVLLYIAKRLNSTRALQ